MKYYLPTLFTTLGLGHQLSLLVGGIESTLKIGCTIIEMHLIDRFGRRITLLTGCIVMSIAMLVSSCSLIKSMLEANTYSYNQINGALPQAYPRNINHASDYACIVFIFFFTFGYSFGFGPAAWVYGAEVCRFFPSSQALLLNSFETDLPNKVPRSRSQLCRLRWSDWLNRSCSGMARWDCQYWIEGLLLLHGD